MQRGDVGGGGGVGGPAAAPGGAVAGVDPAASPAVAALAPCGDRASRAMSLARSAPHLGTDMVLQMAGLPSRVAGLYKDMSAAIGCDGRGGAAVEALLEHWRDPIRGERAAMRALGA